MHVAFGRGYVYPMWHCNRYVVYFWTSVFVGVVFSIMGRVVAYHYDTMQPHCSVYSLTLLLRVVTSCPVVGANSR